MWFSFAVFATLLLLPASALLPPPRGPTTTAVSFHAVQLTARDLEPLEVVAAGPPPLNTIQRRQAHIVTVWRAVVSSSSPSVPPLEGSRSAAQPRDVTAQVFVMARGSAASASGARANGPIIECGAASATRVYVEAWEQDGVDFGATGLLREAALLARSPQRACHSTAAKEVQALEEMLLLVPSEDEGTDGVHGHSWEGCHVRWDGQTLHTSESVTWPAGSDCAQMDYATSPSSESPPPPPPPPLPPPPPPPAPPAAGPAAARLPYTRKLPDATVISRVLEQAVLSAFALQHGDHTGHGTHDHAPTINVSHLQAFLDREYQVRRDLRQEGEEEGEEEVEGAEEYPDLVELARRTPNITIDTVTSSSPAAFTPQAATDHRRTTSALRRRHLLQTKRTATAKILGKARAPLATTTETSSTHTREKRLMDITGDMSHKERQTLALLAGDVQRKHNARDAYLMTGAFSRSLPSLLEETALSFSGTHDMSHNELLAHHSRAVAVMFIEANARVTSLLNVGVQAKEVFAMVVDKIMQMLPEILIILISLLLKIPLTWLISMVLSASMPFALISPKFSFNLKFPGVKFKYGARKKCDCHKFPDQKLRFRETSAAGDNATITTTGVQHRVNNTRDFRVPWSCPPTYGGAGCSVALAPAMCDIVGAGHVKAFGRSTVEKERGAASAQPGPTFTTHQAWGDYVLAGHQNALSEEIHGRMVAAHGYGNAGNAASSAMNAVSIRTGGGTRVSIENQGGILKVFDANCTQILGQEEKEDSEDAGTVTRRGYHVETRDSGKAIVLTTRAETRIMVHRSAFNEGWVNAFFIVPVPPSSSSLGGNGGETGAPLAGLCGDGSAGGSDGGSAGGGSSSENTRRPTAANFKSDASGKQFFCTPPPPLPSGDTASANATSLPEQVFDAVSAVQNCARIDEPIAQAHCVEDLMIAGVDASTRMRLLTASVAEARQRREAQTDLRTVARVVEELHSLHNGDSGRDAEDVTPSHLRGVLSAHASHAEHMTFLQEASDHFSKTMGMRQREVLASVEAAYAEERCRGMCAADSAGDAGVDAEGADTGAKAGSSSSSSSSSKEAAEEAANTLAKPAAQETVLAETSSAASVRSRASVGQPGNDPIMMYQSESREEIRKVTESELVPRIADVLVEGLNRQIPGMRNEVYRGVAQDTSPAMLERLTEMLVESLTGPLTRTLVRDSTTYLASSLTGGLTQSLASTMTHALKRSPKDDYYCALCKSHSLYCSQCRRSAVAAYNDDYYVAYYAAYYSTYASRYYSGPLKDVWLEQAWGEGPEPVVGEAGEEKMGVEKK